MKRRNRASRVLLALATVLLGSMMVWGSPVSAHFPQPEANQPALQGTSSSVGTGGKLGGVISAAPNTVFSNSRYYHDPRYYYTPN